VEQVAVGQEIVELAQMDVVVVGVDHEAMVYT
jgi:hypothetical protein